ncbi:MAG: rhomboid family intramembrane serine protease [Planctomycetota bacterium]|jgi:membrane associated rhomboid family serine protease
MGIYDRDYGRPNPYQQQYSIGGGFKSIPPVVKWLLISNFAIFLLVNLVPALGNIIYGLGAVFPESVGNALQIWRVITYQFLHGGVMHLAFNMIVLYFMGPFIERAWGSRGFLKYYLICGAAGGVVYTVLVLVNVLKLGIMVGASGGIYGLMAAMVIMYPRMKVLLWGIIPMTMYWLVILAVIFSLLNIAIGKNVGGEAAHLTGLAMGFAYVLYKPKMTQFRMKRSQGNWEKKMQVEKNFQQEVDRILDKVHREGVSSLSKAEKGILQEATRREQQGA